MLPIFVEKRNHDDRRRYKRRGLDRAEGGGRPHDRRFRAVSFPSVFKHERACRGGDLLYVVDIDVIHSAIITGNCRLVNEKPCSRLHREATSPAQTFAFPPARYVFSRFIVQLRYVLFRQIYLLTISNTAGAQFRIR